MNNNELQQVKTESFTIGEELPKIEVLEALSIDEMEHVVGGATIGVNDNISVTPGLIWISNPNGDKFEKNGLVGVLRTTFTF